MGIGCRTDLNGHLSRFLLYGPKRKAEVRCHLLQQFLHKRYTKPLDRHSDQSVSIHRSKLIQFFLFYRWSISRFLDCSCSMFCIYIYSLFSNCFVARQGAVCRIIRYPRNCYKKTCLAKEGFASSVFFIWEYLPLISENINNVTQGLLFLS